MYRRGEREVNDAPATSSRVSPNYDSCVIGASGLRAMTRPGWSDRLRLRAHFPRRRVLIVPPGPQGGVGDEAATQALAFHAHQLGAEQVGVVIYGADHDWGLRSAEPPVELVLAPSWPFDRERWSTPEILTTLRHYDHVVIAGADCIDGGYTDLATCALLDLGRFADEQGCRVAFVNCSFNARPTPNALDAIAQLPQRIPFWLRDPLSAESFARRTGKAAHLGAEMAFLTRPGAAADGPVLAWVREQRRAGHRVVALVPNPLAGTPDPLGAPQRDPAPYLAILDTARGDDVRFVVLPNDARETVGDLDLANAIVAGLPPALRDRVSFVPQPMPAAVLHRFFREIDLLIGARFHALVIALSAGTPVIGFEYQGKVRGVLGMVGLEAYSIPVEHGIDPTLVIGRLLHALAHLDELRAAVARTLPGVQRLARSMLESVLAGGG